MQISVGHKYRTLFGAIVLIESAQLDRHGQPILIGDDSRIYDSNGVCLDGERCHDLVSRYQDDAHEKMERLIERIYASDEFTLEKAYADFGIV